MEATFDQVLFNKFVEISSTQATALAMLAERQRKDDETLARIVASQEALSRSQAEIVASQERIAERLDHMDSEAQRRTASAIDVVKSAMAAEVSKTLTANSAGDRWIKILCALLGFIAAALTAIVVMNTRRGGG